MKELELIELFKQDCIKSYDEENKGYPTEDFEEVSYELFDSPEYLKLENFEFLEDKSKTNYDSYGNEDSELAVIYKLKDSERFVMLYGTRQSYSGTSLGGVKEVKMVTKQITVFE